MTAQTTEALWTTPSVDEAFWELILADPDYPPPDQLPPADGSPVPGHGRLCRPAAHLDRPRVGASRTVPTSVRGKVRSPPLPVNRPTAGVGRRRP